MPRYTATIEQDGMIKTLTINADSRDEASHKLTSKGINVIKVAGDDPEPVDVPAAVPVTPASPEEAALAKQKAGAARQKQNKGKQVRGIVNTNWDVSAGILDALFASRGWMTFIGVTMIIFCSLSFLASLIIVGASAEHGRDEEIIASLVTGIFQLPLLVLLFIYAIKLLTSSSALQQAYDKMDSDALELALRRLRSSFIMIGVCFIILIGYIGLFLIGAILAIIASL